MINTRIIYCLFIVSLLFGTSDIYAQRVIQSGVQSAGFRFSSDKKASNPVIYYQQNIQMLSGIDDRLSVSIFGDGRVFVHYPVYMKKAGDYEMKLNEDELASMLRSLSSDGIMDFDETKVKKNRKKYQQSMRSKGQLYAVSDAVVTTIDVRLDEYQKNKSARKVKNFRKQVKLKNIEHDAKRFKFDPDITKANNAVLNLKTLMKDARLLKQGRR